jgi:AcrR family transcriptional regulator
MSSHSRPVKRARRRAPRPPDPAAETLPVKQTRSRETVARLLDAAEALLVDGGLEAATVPRIAERAGLSVGVVYRRFPDKDALLRAVYERFFERARGGNTHAADPQWWEGISLPDMARTLVGSLVAAHRRHRELLRALTAYTQASTDPEFRRRIDELNAHTIERLAALVLTRRKEIQHPDPERAVVFGLFMVAATLRTLMQASERALRPFGISEATLGEELTRMYLQYLGVRGKPTRNPVLHGPRAG